MSKTIKRRIPLYSRITACVTESIARREREREDREKERYFVPRGHTPRLFARIYIHCESRPTLYAPARCITARILLFSRSDYSFMSLSNFAASFNFGMSSSGAASLHAYLSLTSLLHRLALRVGNFTCANQFFLNEIRLS